MVDTSVWIDFFNDRCGREVARLDQAIATQESIHLCGPILRKVLQGFRKEEDFQRRWRDLMKSGVLETTRWTYLRAASLYRFPRRKGATVNSFDTTIAAVCFERRLPLLTRDRRDFAPMANDAGLKLA